MWQHYPLALLEQYGISWTIPLVGLAVGFVALIVGRLISARPSDEADSGPTLTPALEKGAGSDKVGERRAAPRRGGNLMEIELKMPEGVEGPSTAVVHDRSLGGLCLVATRSVPDGTVVQVSTRTPRERGRLTVPAVVIACKRTPDGWTINCRFERQLTYHELTLFE